MQAFRPMLCSGTLQHLRYFNTSSTSYLIQKWRIDKGLPMNPNTSGVLTDSPDYTFLDGRLTPYGEGQKERILKQRNVKEDIMKFTKEVDFAVERHRSLLEAEENKKNMILSRKLKAKGLNLLKASSKK